MYRLDAADGERFVLRVGHVRVCRDETETRSELAWLAALATDTTLAVPRVVETLSGDALVPVEGNGPWRHATLFRWMPGYTIGARLGQSSARSIGEVVAGLHEHAARFRLPPGHTVRRGDRVLPWSSDDFTANEPVLLFKRQFRELYPHGLRRTYERADARAEEAIAALFSARPKPRLIHNDLHPWNVLRHDDEVGVLDFEDLVLGYPVQDVATFFYYLRIRHNGERLAELFRDGYQSRLPWPVDGAAQLGALVSGRGLILANLVLAGIDDFGRDTVRGWLERIGERLVRWQPRSRR